MIEKSDQEKKVAVIGAGSWGTSLALLLARKGHKVFLWAFDGKEVDDLLEHRENKRFLPGFPLPETIFPVKSLRVAAKDADVILMVTPSHGVRNVFNDLEPFIEADTKIISATKGIENKSLKTMTQVMSEILETKRRKDIITGVLTGPSFAKEVAQKVPTAVTIGFTNLETAVELQNVFVSDYFRVYASDDVIGLELSGALKNIIAIGAGMCDGLEYGLNTRAALITRGLAEIQRLGLALGARASTFYGLSGMGDLILTCTGDLSRNRSVGLKLGEGNNIKTIEEEMDMVAEGVKTTLSVYNLAQREKVEMPILEQVYKILYEGKDCRKAVDDLLQRDLKIE